jgi:allophanate hydrolase
VRTGQTLTVHNARVAAVPEADIPCPVWARPARSVQCVLGPQDRFFAPETLATFTHTPFELTHTYDRMGVRLRGPSLLPRAALSIPSEPIVRGSVQVSGDGAPTVLLADHQTTGGYPKIATLLADDVDRLVQCRPPDAVRFEPLAPAQAIAQRRFRAQQHQAYLQRLSSVFGASVTSALS